MNDDIDFWGMRYGRRGGMMHSAKSGMPGFRHSRAGFMGNCMGRGMGIGFGAKPAILEELSNKPLSADEIKQAIEDKITNWFRQGDGTLELQLKWLEYNGFIKKASDNKYEITEYGREWLGV
jgi:hypothetical protein